MRRVATFPHSRLGVAAGMAEFFLVPAALAVFGVAVIVDGQSVQGTLILAAGAGGALLATWMFRRMRHRRVRIEADEDVEPAPQR